MQYRSRAAMAVALSLPVLAVGCGSGRAPTQITTENAAGAANRPVEVNGPKPAPPDAGPSGPSSTGSAATPGHPSAALSPVVEPIKPQGEPVAPPSEGVRLAYRFVKGQKSRFELTTRQEAAVETKMPEGGASPGILPPGGFRIDGGGTIVLVQEVRSIAGNGDATIATRVDSGDFRINSPSVGGELVVRVRDGKAEMTLNGQNQEAGMPGAALLSMFQPGKDLVVSTLGVVQHGPGSPASGAGPGGVMSGVAGGIGSQTNGGYGLLVLPARAVKPGDSWTDGKAPSASAGDRKKSGAALSTQFTLKEIRMQAGRRVAVIEAVSTSTGPPGTGAAGRAQHSKMLIKTTGTNQFDIDAGELIAASYRIEMDMSMSFAAPSTRPGAPGGTGEQAPTREPVQFTMRGGTSLNVVRKPNP